MTRFLFVLLAVCALVCAENCAEEEKDETSVCSFGGRRASGPENLEYCTWYGECSCCNENDEPAPSYGDTSCGEPSEGCKEIMDLKNCLICSPESGAYLNGAGFNICSGFSKKLFSACKDAGHCNLGKDCQNDQGQCSTVKEVFNDDHEQFSNSMQLFITPGAECFNAASSVAPTAVLFAAVAVVAAFL